MQVGIYRTCDTIYTLHHNGHDCFRVNRPTLQDPPMDGSFHPRGEKVDHPKTAHPLLHLDNSCPSPVPIDR